MIPLQRLARRPHPPNQRRRREHLHVPRVGQENRVELLAPAGAPLRAALRAGYVTPFHSGVSDTFSFTSTVPSAFSTVSCFLCHGRSTMKIPTSFEKRTCTGCASFLLKAPSAGASSA